MTDETTTPEPKKHQHGRTLDIREEAMRDIYAHLEVNGPKNFKPLIEKWTARGAAESTIWKWVRVARKMDAPKVSLVAAKALIEQRMAAGEPDPDAPAPAIGEIASQLPVAPSPDYVAKHGERAVRNLDILSELHSIQSDAMMLRDYAVKMVKNPETDEEREAIKNPVFFEKQMQRRLNVIDTALKAMGEVWNLRTMQSFYETVIQEIGRADPETQKRIMLRLSALNARTGMSLDMRV